jgi:hypothetical protein
MSLMLDRFLWEQLFHLCLNSKKFERRLDNAVEEKREVNQHDKSHRL